MSTEARYFRVGLFVLVGIAVIVAAVLVLAGGNLFRRPVVAETYFDEAVEGLEVGSPVKLRGVQIGQVSWIGFVDDVYEDVDQNVLRSRQVMVLMDIVPPEGDEFALLSEERRRRRVQALIDAGMRLRLTTGVLTGTSFLQADFLDPERHPPPEIDWEPEHLYLPSAPSTMVAISTAAERIFRRLENVNVDQVVKNIDALVAALTERVNDLDVAALEQRTSDAVEQLDATLLSAQRLLEGGRYDLQAALENLRVASENLRDVTDTARDYPSLLILGQPPEPSKEVTR
jgi:paraquat-inducible protein B